jgi:hypothetical protein
LVRLEYELNWIRWFPVLENKERKAPQEQGCSIATNHGSSQASNDKDMTRAGDTEYAAISAPIEEKKATPDKFFN